MHSRLLKQINGPSKELTFIPINNSNFHWSLLIYEISTKKFYHYDTLQGVNDKYIRPLVRELVEQIQAVRNIKEDYLGRYLIKNMRLGRIMVGVVEWQWLPLWRELWS
ncbi:MAG: hypothetical protein MRERV_1c061 [Mycoplasmataceae bacterium RV_VA103A]|nr:MAG: hypothetical protein MRERV_1c061 [Mycoplasmataceae bacterium RV_VA103A]